MLLIEDGVIYLTRGDDAEIEVEITDGAGDAYAMQDGDTLALTVREVPTADSPVIFAVESDTNRIVLNHDDTAGVAVGRYSADIELRSNGLRRTIFPKPEGAMRYREKNFRNFMIMPEVTI